jgi:hypothetical protein
MSIATQYAKPWDAPQVLDNGGAVYNVKHRRFGARGDDLTDDTAAISAAYAAARATGGTVFFPPGIYRFSSLALTTLGSEQTVTLKGSGYQTTILRPTLAAATATEYAIDIGDAATTNSGQVSLQDLTIKGDLTAGEANAIRARKGQRYTYWNNVRVHQFDKGTGLTLDELWLLNWGNLIITNCYQAVSGSTLNAFSIDNLAVEICGPVPSVAPADWPAYGWTYAHSTIADTEPSVHLQGIECTVTNLSIEANLAKTNLKIEDKVHVLSYYAEANYAWDVGNEILFGGVGPKLDHGTLQNGVYSTPPNPRYMISMGDSDGARIEGLVYETPGPNPTNSLHGVDFATSDRAEVNIFFRGYDNITQQAARGQLFRGNSKRFTLNGQRYVAGFPIDQLARVLWEEYSASSLNPRDIGLMNRPASTGVALGFSPLNLSAGSVLVNDKRLVGKGRVQKIERSGAAEAGVYHAISAGVLSTTDKYFVSSYIYADWSAGLGAASMQTVNGASTTTLSPRVGNRKGWERISNIRTFSDGASEVRIYPCRISSTAPAAYTACCFLVNLSAFDAAHGTSLAGMSVHEVEEILDIRLLEGMASDEYAHELPTTGSYKRGDRVWKGQPSAGTAEAWACITGGTPGTWRVHSYTPGWGFTGAGVTTPDVSDGYAFKSNNSSATTITNFSGGADGQRIVVRVADANTTIQNNVSIVTASGADITAQGVYEFILDGSVWREI